LIGAEPAGDLFRGAGAAVLAGELAAFALARLFLSDALEAVCTVICLIILRYLEENIWI
jgi:hypothetical protein